MKNERSPMIKRIERDSARYNVEDTRGEKIFKGVSLGMCLFASVYFGNGVLKSLGEIENQGMAKARNVPAAELSHGDYLLLGTKNLAKRIYSTFSK